MKGERFDWGIVLSVFIGFIGVVILINPFSNSGAFLENLIYKCATLLASASWSLSLILIKRLPDPSPLRMTRNILLAASVEIVIVWLLIGHPTQIGFHLVPFVNAFFLGALTSGVVYFFYILLIRSSGVNFASFSNYIVPIVAGILGVVFLNERFTLMEVVGFIVIVVGLCIQSYHDLLKSS